MSAAKPMLPDWKTPSADDKRRFARFVIEQLDAADHDRAVAGLRKIAATDPADMTAESRVAFIRAIANSGAPPALLERIGHLFGVDIGEIADHLERIQALGFDIKQPTGQRGVKSDQSESFRNATEDVPRIRALFGSLWNRRNRTERPLAEEIAAQRWSLSEIETALLIDRFQRRG